MILSENSITVDNYKKLFTKRNDIDLVKFKDINTIVDLIALLNMINSTYYTDFTIYDKKDIDSGKIMLYAYKDYVWVEDEKEIKLFEI